ncbi:MAG: outer membrane beta-barrel protein [Terriglobales bacterium]
MLLRRLLRGKFLALLAATLISATVMAQEEPTPKVELFVGYQWLHPGATVPSPFQPPNAPVGQKMGDIAQGAGASFTYNFTPHWGLEADYGGNKNDNGSENTASIGPRVAWRGEGVTFFAHTLLGFNRLTVPQVNTSNGLGAILGGGMDLSIWRRLSLRLFEADYVWAHHNFADEVSPAFPDLRRPTLEGVRLRTGLVFNFGYPSAAIPAASCSIQPSEVMVGEPVTATASASNFNPKHTLTYNWASTGGKITGKDTTATLDTNGVAGGSYTVTAHVTDPKMKKGGEASCTATFTVKEPPKNPPTMSCSANPTSVQAGTPSTLTCTCTSPDNVPVTISGWTASGGSVSGEGGTATLNTTGAAAGPITVSATCTDSRGLTASSSSQVNVENPPPPPPEASKLSECQFPNPVKPWRVDNTCKAVLDDVAQRLQHDPDAKLVIVGNAEPGEKRKNLAAERAVNSKAYLSGGEAKQAIDASRIETRTGSAGTKTAEYWVVPAGATFSAPGTEAVDESVVKAVPDHPVAPKKGARKPKAQ